MLIAERFVTVKRATTWWTQRFWTSWSLAMPSWRNPIASHCWRNTWRRRSLINSRPGRLHSAPLFWMLSNLVWRTMIPASVSMRPTPRRIFAEIFDPIIDDYHGGFKKTDKHPPKDFGDVDSFGNLDPTVSFFFDIYYLNYILYKNSKKIKNI